MLRLPLEGLHAGERTLPAASAHYLTRVHRLERGAKLVVFDPRARLEAVAELLDVRPRAVRVHIGEPRPAENLPTRAVSIIQGVGKGSKIDGVLRDATELGATGFVVAIGERSVRKPDSRLRERLERLAVEAARQCGRGDVPLISGPLPLSDALAAAPAEALRLLLMPGAKESMASALDGVPNSTELVLAVGPEGGLSESELATALAHGYRSVFVGRFVLRTETACAAALGAIAARG
ncbi:MAG: 16S rRNA (uracil(1498)-N(3))-methyltransferase [Myxococcales bacterium]|nr:16S rRNA (uracil(1498)-N(3))-methyltransferase [Myxococcales bacterium]